VGSCVEKQVQTISMELFKPTKTNLILSGMKKKCCVRYKNMSPFSSNISKSNLKERLTLNRHNLVKTSAFFGSTDAFGIRTFRPLAFSSIWTKVP